jgi:hypothetical protein
LIAIPRLIVVGVAIWAGWQTTRMRNRPGFGTVIVDRTSFTIDDCKKVPVSGPDSIGADLRGPDGNVLRLVRDEREVRLWLYPKGASVAIPIDRRDCSQWEVSFFSEAGEPLRPSGGDVNITCAAGGRKIDGAVFFEHCRP